MKYITKLKARASMGKTSMLALISTPIKATKIVDGKAIVNMNDLIPFTCSLLLNLLFSKKPKRMNDKK